MKLVSIIVPVYNVEKYLVECLDSIIAQTYKNIEIICVNDGSTDNSGKICDKYSKKYKNVFVIHKQNEGLGYARNTGLEHAKGEYVLFIDSDDYIDQDMIEVLIKNLQKNKVDICRCGYKKVDDTKKILFEDKLENLIFKKQEAKTKLLPRMLGSSPTIKDSIDVSATHVLYNIDVIKKNNIKFPSEREFISEDLVFNIDYMQHASGACLIDYCGYNYRCNPSSLSCKYRIDRFEATKYFYTNISKKLLDYEYDTDTIQRLSRYFFILIKMCISQEKKKISHNKVLRSIKNIKKICNDKDVQNSINNYPVNKLGFKQQVFLHMIKYKLYFSLYVLSTLNLI